MVLLPYEAIDVVIEAGVERSLHDNDDKFGQQRTYVLSCCDPHRTLDCGFSRLYCCRLAREHDFFANRQQEKRKETTTRFELKTSRKKSKKDVRWKNVGATWVLRIP